MNGGRCKNRTPDGREASSAICTAFASVFSRKHFSGTHKVHLQIRDENLFQSPHVVKVYDSERIQVTGIESGTVGNPVQFTGKESKRSGGSGIRTLTLRFVTVDATNAGYGSLEIAIKDSDGNIIPSKVNAMQDSTSKFTVSFLPQKADDYGIHVSFNQENLKGMA